MTVAASQQLPSLNDDVRPTMDAPSTHLPLTLHVRTSSVHNRTDSGPMRIKDIYTHRWFRVCAFGLAITFTSCLFAGWQQYSLILTKGGMYGWACLPGTIRPYPEIPFIHSCPEQDRLIASLFPIASGFELVGALCAGVALDKAGPRLCAAIGLLLGGISYLMLIGTSAKFNLLVMSMVVNGIAINLISFPALCLEDFFPSAAATTAAFVVACQALSSIVAPGLWMLWRMFPSWTYKHLWSGYLAFVFIPCAILFIVALPSVRPQRPVVREGPIPSEATLQHNGTFRELSPSFMEGQEEDGGMPPAPGFRWTSLLALCFTRQFLVLNAISVVLMVQNAYYQVIVRPVMGVNVSNFLGYTMPSQAIWGLLLGRLCDHYKTPAICGLLLLIYFVIYVMVPLGKSDIQFINVTLFNIAMSFAFTIKYSYIQETFSQKYYGSLVGVSGLLGGIGVFSTNLLTMSENYNACSIFLSALSISFMPLCVVLASWAQTETFDDHRLMSPRTQAILSSIPSASALFQKSPPEASSFDYEEIGASTRMTTPYLDD